MKKFLRSIYQFFLTIYIFESYTKFSKINKKGMLNFVLILPWSEVSEKKIKRRVSVIKNLVKSIFKKTSYQNTKFIITVYKLRKNFVDKDLLYKLTF